MKLYKNVDLKDLEKILSEGILPISKTGNDWDGGKRVNNSKDVVYLAKPKSRFNSFTGYGDVLLEVETDSARSNKLSDLDVNWTMYDEYVADEIPSNEIINIYIPEKMKTEVSIKDERIQFVDVLEHINRICVASVYDIPNRETGLLNYNPANASEVLVYCDWDDTEEHAIVDLSTKRLIKHSNLKKELHYRANVIKNGVLLPDTVKFKEAGTTTNLEEIMGEVSTPVGHASYVLSNDVASRQKEIAKEMKQMILEQPELFFTKKMDWRRNAGKTLEKMYKEKRSN